MSLQCFAKFSAKIGHPGHCSFVNFPETTIFSKNNPNLRGKIEDRQKFLTKKIKEISAPKKTIFKKFISYILPRGACVGGGGGQNGGSPPRINNATS
jgi:hypothetical protein